MPTRTLLRFSLLVWLFGSFFSTSFWGRARADEIKSLPPIIRDATPVESLTSDPVLPSAEALTDLDNASGAVQHTLTNDLPFSSTDTGHPGEVSQLRGLGRSSEDINVQTLGIPLNYPQGTGFDSSIFPQYFWSEFRFQNGPSLGVLDPRAVSGTLNLVPWTEQALLDPSARGRLSGLYASTGLYQVAAGVKATPDLALLAGSSFGDAQGPSGSVSGNWRLPGIAGRFHLLATDIDASPRPFPGSVGTPMQHTSRVIPVVQADIPIGQNRDNLFKTSFYYDNTYLHYQDPSVDSRYRIQQYGAENAVFYQGWKIGLSARQAFYAASDFSSPNETILSEQIGRSIRAGEWLVDPVFQVIEVTDFGTLPQGGLGLRYEPAAFEKSLAFFARASYSRRVPTLADRYAVNPFFTGNPALVAEEDYTGVVGAEAHLRDWDFTIQGLSQYRGDAEVPYSPAAGTFSVQNSGYATIGAVTLGAAYRGSDRFDWADSATFQQTNLSATDTDFPYQPRFIDTLSAAVYPIHPRGFAEAVPFLRGSARFSSSVLVDAAGGGLPGYGYLDVSAGGPLLRDLQLVLNLENVFDRPIELVKGYPTPGRVVSVLLSAQL